MRTNKKLQTTENLQRRGAEDAEKSSLHFVYHPLEVSAFLGVLWISALKEFRLFKNLRKKTRC